MLNFILWYLLITALGLLTFPLAYLFFPALAGRGYAFSRALGWLLWGYIFWMLGSLGVLGNDAGGELVALLLIAVLSAWALRRAGWKNLRAWLRAERGLIVTVEVFFLLAFLAMAVVRAANPEIIGTEKPMELAFINANLRSPTLPPHDPWLSGYAISYYYFGFLLVAMFARLTATTGGVAFNLGIALVFALSAVGAYGVLYELLRRREPQTTNRQQRSAVRSRLSALLAPFFTLIVSNLGGLLHLLRLNGVFWRKTAEGEWVSPLWAWLDIGSFSQPPPMETFPHWWWWQASRLVQDFDFNWVNKGDVIDEFPFFSYLLGDLHPHVLAMPFAFLMVALALNLFFGGAEGEFPRLPLRLAPRYFLLAAVLIGGMAFLNTWDFPFYVALFAGAYVLRGRTTDDGRQTAVSSQPSAIELGKQFLALSFTLALTGILLYFPFYLGFSSQAGGLLPNQIYVTRGVYLWLMFAPLFFPLMAYLFWRVRRPGFSAATGFKVTAALTGLLYLLSLALVGLIAILPLFRAVDSRAVTAPEAFLLSQAAPGFGALILEGLTRRLTVPGTLLTLGVLLTLTLGWLWPRREVEEAAECAATPGRFVLLLTLLGGLLVFAPEFVYLRDMFGYRINTIFKFYYLAWLLWSLAAAYALVVLWGELRGLGGGLFRLGMLILLGVSLLYPAMGLWSKTNGFQPAEWTLDGTAYWAYSNPDERAAMEWLRQAPLGVVAEAVGGSYTGFARMATHSGQPTVLGWEFHEMQWRGGVKEMGSRKADIERLYCLPNWEEARLIVQQYDIRYVVVGQRERSAYTPGNTCLAGLSEAKFLQNLAIAFRQDAVTIYKVPDPK